MKSFYRVSLSKIDSRANVRRHLSKKGCELLEEMLFENYYFIKESTV